MLKTKNLSMTSLKPKEDVDGESQELLLLNCMTLINQQLGSGSRSNGQTMASFMIPEMFFFFFPGFLTKMR